MPKLNLLFAVSSCPTERRTTYGVNAFVLFPNLTQLSGFGKLGRRLACPRILKSCGTGLVSMLKMALLVCIFPDSIRSS